MKSKKINIIIFILFLVTIIVGFIFLISAKFELNRLTKGFSSVFISNHVLDKWTSANWFQNHDFLANHSDLTLFFYLNFDKVFDFYVYVGVRWNDLLKLSSPLLVSLIFIGLMFLEIIVPLFACLIIIMFIVDLMYISKHNFWDIAIHKQLPILSNEKSRVLSQKQEKHSLHEIRINVALGKDLPLTKKEKIDKMINKMKNNLDAW